MGLCKKVGAEGGIRTPTPYGATPSRWCVCQFRHFRKGRSKKSEHALSIRERLRSRRCSSYFDGGVEAGGAAGGVDALGVAGVGAAGAGTTGLLVFENCCNTELPDAEAVEF